MQIFRFLVALALSSIVLGAAMSLAPPAWAQEELARLVISPARVELVPWQTDAPLELGVVGPNGEGIVMRSQDRGALGLEVFDDAGTPRPDGLYLFELRAPASSDGVARSQSGSFQVHAGRFLVPAVEEESLAFSSTPELLQRDVVQTDDLIVRGRLCVGIVCAGGEDFQLDTLRLKDNNTRIRFWDTSTAIGIPSTDWQLTANDSVTGGLNKFSIDDLTAGTSPFTVQGGAPTNSLFITSQGRLGLGTRQPNLQLQVNNSSSFADGLWIVSDGGGESVILLSTFAPGVVAQSWSLRGELNGDLSFINAATGTSMVRVRPGGTAPDRLVVTPAGVEVQGELRVNGAAINAQALAGLQAKNAALERRLAALEARLAVLAGKTSD